MIVVIFFPFEKVRIRAVAFAHHLEMKIVDGNLGTVSEIMEAALKELSMWAGEGGFGANPNMT